MVHGGNTCSSELAVPKAYVVACSDEYPFAKGNSIQPRNCKFRGAGAINLDCSPFIPGMDYGPLAMDYPYVFPPSTMDYRPWTLMGSIVVVNRLQIGWWRWRIIKQSIKRLPKRQR